MAILDHDGRFGSLRRKEAREVPRSALPAHVPTLSQLFETCSLDLTLSIDVKDPAAARPVFEVALAAGVDLDRLYLCSGDLDELEAWAAFVPRPRLVQSTRLRRLRPGPERYVAELSRRGVDALDMPYPDWVAGWWRCATDSASSRSGGMPSTAARSTSYCAWAATVSTPTTPIALADALGTSGP